MKKLKYDQVPPEFETRQIDPTCTYPDCGCPMFNC